MGSSREMTRIVLADHHPICLKGFKCLFKNSKKFKIVGKTNDGRELKNVLEMKPPDVLIFEIDLPHSNGILALRSLRKDFPMLKILVVSCHPEELYALSSIKAGASGYISKTASIKEIKRAVKRVASGKIHINEQIAGALEESNGQKKNDILNFKKLSTRESEVLNLLAIGKRNKDVASVLGVNEKTVSTYKKRLMKKLKVTSITELINHSRLLQLN